MLRIDAKKLRHPFRFAVPTAFATALAALACSASGGDTGLAAPRGSNGGSGAEMTGGFAGIGGASGSMGVGGSGVSGFGGAGGAPVTDGCAGITAKAERKLASVLVLLDLTGTMQTVVPGGTRYSVTRDAIANTLQTLPSELWMGLVYFGHGLQPPPGCAKSPLGCCTRDSANGGPDIPLQPILPPHRQALLAFMQQTAPSDINYTPIQGGLEGAWDIMKTAQVPGDRYVLFMTDGTENCGGKGPDILAGAAAAAAGSPSVKTFVIGSPGSGEARNFLSNLAVQGQTSRIAGCSSTPGNTCHYDMSSSGAAIQTELTQAMQAILSNLVVPCAFDIPPQQGGAFDPNQVNVEWINGTQGTKNVVPQDTNADCANASGWQYSADGKQILLCGSACTDVQADKHATINIVFGCPTIVR